MSPSPTLHPTTVDVEQDPAVRLAFTARDTGNLSLVVGGGAVADARAQALRAVGSTLSDAVFMQQVHGAGVALVSAADRGRGARHHDTAIAGADALVTFDTDVALAVLVADCVPLLLCRPGVGVAAVHAGRRGIEQGVVVAAVRRLAPTGAAEVVAVMGPAIGGCCYEVPADMAAGFAAAVGDGVTTTTWGTPSLDLPRAVGAQLTAAGVGVVRRVGGCTRCDAGRWFSHRADTAPGGGPQGRQAGVIVRRGVPEPCL